MEIAKVHSCSVDPPKVAQCSRSRNYMYTPLTCSMAYYAYFSTANLRAYSAYTHTYIHVCISKEQCCNKELYTMYVRDLEILRSYSNFSERLN